MREVIEASLRLFGGSVLGCLPLATVGTLLGQLPAAYDIAIHGRPVPLTAASLAAKDGQWWALYVLGTLASLALWAIVLLKQERIATGGAHGSVPLGTTLARLPAIFGYCAGSFVVMLLASLPFGLIAALVPMSPGQRGALVLLPVLVTAAALSLGWPALVVDRRGPLKAIDIGLRLAVAHWRRLLLVLAAVLATGIVMLILAGLAIGVFAGLAAPAGEAVQNSLAAAIMIAAVALMVLYLSAFLLVVFDDLRVRTQASSASNAA